MFSSSSKSIVLDENIDFDVKADDEARAAFDSGADIRAQKRVLPAFGACTQR
jgi:hypothetical protein